MKTKVFAKLKYPNAGYDFDVEDAKMLNKKYFYEVENIDMGQSYTNIKLKNIKIHFNSVQFKFYNEDKKKIDIFSMPEFNPYLDTRE
jgi:hypothetical protein